LEITKKKKIGRWDKEGESETRREGEEEGESKGVKIERPIKK